MTELLQRKDDTKGTLAIIGATILYGFEWIVTRKLNKLGLNSFAITFGFILIAVVVLYFFTRFKKIDLKIKSKEDTINLVLLGLFFSLNAILFYTALIKGLIASVLLHND